jgi:hypothetical protein
MTLNVVMRQGVQVTTTRKLDAECISDALGQYGGKVDRDGRHWFVQLSASEGAALPELLTALKQCLDENAIAAVKVELDGQAYAMEGLTYAGLAADHDKADRHSLDEAMLWCRIGRTRLNEPFFFFRTNSNDDFVCRKGR